MPEIQIRPATPADLPAMIAIDPDYVSDYVWQMEIQAEENQVKVSFREVRLPRSVRVDYPRLPANLKQDWDQRSGLLVAILGEEVVGYASLMLNLAPLTAWVTDLVVMRRLRRQGIGSALLLAAEEWASQHNSRHLVIEMQPKNYPAIHMAQKLGFDFCGYNDRYYPNHDIGLFFGKLAR
ncbi:MAG TPA: GNAT family N-acetyltransferase [Anaerolineales bacterium]